MTPLAPLTVFHPKYNILRKPPADMSRVILALSSLSSVGTTSDAIRGGGYGARRSDGRARQERETNSLAPFAPFRATHSPSPRYEGAFSGSFALGTAGGSRGPVSSFATCFHVKHEQRENEGKSETTNDVHEETNGKKMRRRRRWWAVVRRIRLGPFPRGGESEDDREFPGTSERRGEGREQGSDRRRHAPLRPRAFVK